MGKHTPGPWTFSPGGGHAYPSIRGSDSIHTSGRLHGGGVSSRSFSDEVCEIRADPSLEGPRANIGLILAAPELLAIAQRWAALDGGAWHPQRYATEKAELLADTRAAIAKAEGEL